MYAGGSKAGYRAHSGGGDGVAGGEIRNQFPTQKAKGAACGAADYRDPPAELPGGLDGLSQKKAQHRNGGNAGDAKVHMVTSHFMLCADGAECTGNDTEAQIVLIAGQARCYAICCFSSARAISHGTSWNGESCTQTGCSINFIKWI